MSKKYCLITGAAGFLGMHYCQLLLQNNYNVIGVDINTKPFKRIKNKSFKSYYCDISDEKEVKVMFLNFKKKKYFINILINNAAIDSVPLKKLKNSSNVLQDTNLNYFLIITQKLLKNLINTRKTLKFKKLIQFNMIKFIIL